MIYKLRWYQSSTGKEFPNYYAIALGDMEDDGCDVLFSIEKKEILFVPRYIGYHMQEEDRVSKYEREVGEFLKRNDFRVFRFKQMENGEETAKAIDPFTGELISDSVREEGLHSFLKNKGKILIADGVSLGEVFYDDNEIRPADIKFIRWKAGLGY